MEDLLAREIEAVGDDNVAKVCSSSPCGPDSRLQARPSSLQQSFGNGPLFQVQVVRNGVDNDARLGTTDTIVKMKD